MIPVRRNIDTDKLILWLDPSSPLSYTKSQCILSIAGKGKNQFAGTTEFTNTFNLNGVKASWTNDTQTPYGRRFVEPILDGMIVDPDGGNQTRLLRETTDTGERYLRQDMLIEKKSLSGPTNRITYSLYVRQDLASDARQIRISHKNSSPDTGGVVYDFATSTLTALNASALEDYGAIPASGGWVRIYYTLLIDGITSGVNARTFIYLLDGAGNVIYTGDGTSGVYVYGPQWEQGVLSNYSRVVDGGEFEGGYQNRKLGRLDSANSPKYYTNTAEGTNLRFDGVNSGLNVHAGPRNPFRSTGIATTSLQNHTVFAWIKCTPTQSPDGIEQIATLLGRIGGKKNNGIFGINQDGTKIKYKVRARYSTPSGGTSIPIATLESDSFSTIANKWNLIAADFDYLTGTVSFYLNGAPVGTDSLTTVPTYTPLGIDGSGSGPQLGYYSDSNNQVAGQYKGYLNMLGFYDKKLSGTEHRKLYYATNYRFV